MPGLPKGQPGPLKHLSSRLKQGRTLHDDFLRLSLWRGGTSKGLFINPAHLWKATTNTEVSRLGPGPNLRWLETHQRSLQPLLSALMGSPDPHERQLDGLGGGISSLSKAVVVGSRQSDASDRPFTGLAGGIPSDTETMPAANPQLEYTFIQVGVKGGELDMSGNCGNLSAAVGPYAVDERMIQLETSRLDLDHAVRIYEDPMATYIAAPATVHLFNNNTNKTIRSTFMVSRPENRDGEMWRFEPRGNYTMPGVPGTGSEIRLQWLDPGGSKTSAALPTGNVTDSLTVNGKVYSVSLVDVSNPGIFIDGRELGWDPARSPDDLNAQTDVMDTLDLIRRKGTEMMGLDPNVQAVPKIVMVFPSSAEDTHIDCRALSMQKAHKAVPGTLAMNLGAACQMPGTVPYQLARKSTNGKVTIGHPTGTAEVGAKVENGHVEYVELSRTARCLMSGIAFPARRDYSIEKIDRDGVEMHGEPFTVS